MFVALAYGGDTERAAGHTDEQVAATVADWERSQGIPVRDWQRIGWVDEGRFDDWMDDHDRYGESEYDT